jgi:hypothetical protein
MTFTTYGSANPYIQDGNRYHADDFSGTLLIRIREVLDSNVGRNTGHLEFS